VRLGEPARGIIMTATDRAADLVVMASHGRTGISRAVFGSVTGAVLRDGSTPVLVIHPRVERAAALAGSGAAPAVRATAARE
jgi:nucleotide-binding universal stress UspA family protein